MGNLHYGDVEFAVFNAATWSVLFPGQDTPSGGVVAGEAVYAFQVFDNGAKPAGITQFSAGLSDILPFGDLTFDNELVTTGDSDYIAGTGQDPNQVSPIGSSVPWKFLGANAINSEGSSVLFYTSPFGPRWDNGGTTSGAGAVAHSGAGSWRTSAGRIHTGAIGVRLGVVSTLWTGYLASPLTGVAPCLLRWVQSVRLPWRVAPSRCS